MKYDIDLEIKVESAVQEYAISVRSNKNVENALNWLTDATNQLPLRHLDRWERLIRDAFSNEIERRNKWFLFKPKPRFLTWLDVFSWDGYKREKALRTLTEPVPNSFFFAMILRRLNDWVPQVRVAAREHLPVIVDSSNPNFVVEAICSTVTSWKSWGRMEEPDKKSLYNLLSNEHIFDTLLHHIVSRPSGPVMLLLSQCGRNENIDSYLPLIAKNAIQPSVRAKAYRSQLDGAMKWQDGHEWKWTDKPYGVGHFIPKISQRVISKKPAFEETLHAASIDKSSVVRRVAAEFLIRDINQLSKHTAMKYAQRFEKDTSPTVSERGKFALRQLNSDT